MTDSIEKIQRIIDNAGSFVLTTHVAPDGDAIGSVLALQSYLESKNKKAVIINHSPTPFNLQFMDRHNKIRVYSDDIDANESLINEADVVFLLDTNEYHRTRSMENVIRNSPAKKICIDHHAGIREDMFDAVLSETQCAATCQILYSFIAHDNEEYITPDVASQLYVGIMTDTGSFRHPRTDSDVFRISAKLLDRGADPVYLYEEINNRVSKEMMQLQALFISGLEFYFDGKVVIGKVRQEDFRRFGLNIDHIEGFSSIVMSIDGVKVGVLMVELRDNIKLSFRTKGQIPANAMATEFGGGGHFNAGGANVEGATIDELKPKIIDIVEKYLNGKI